MKVIIFESDKCFINGLREIISFVNTDFNKNIDIKLITTDEVKVMDQIEKLRENSHEANVYIINPEINGTLNGLKVAQKIHTKDPLGYIVFVSNKNYYREAIASNVRAYAYFYKPLGYGEFSSLVDSIELDYKNILGRFILRDEKIISVTTGRKKTLLPVSSIVALEYRKPKTTVYTLDGKCICYNSLKDIEEKIASVDGDNTMIRTHAAYSININNAHSLNTKENFLTTVTGFDVPIARARKKVIEELFSKSKLTVTD